MTVLPIECRSAENSAHARQSIASLLSAHEIDLGSLHDDAEGSVKKSFGVHAVPIIINLDRAGIVTATHFGMGSKWLDWLRTHANDALARPYDATPR